MSNHVAQIWHKDEEWGLDELPPNLATLTCTHLLEEGAPPAFVDYNEGDLTIFCPKGADHMDESAYRMVCLSHFLGKDSPLHATRLVGGCSMAELQDGRWKITLTSPHPQEDADDI